MIHNSHSIVGGDTIITVKPVKGGVTGLSEHMTSTFLLHYLQQRGALL